MFDETPSSPRSICIRMAKVLRDNPYDINIAKHNAAMMERNKVKMRAMQQAVAFMRENMPD